MVPCLVRPRSVSLVVVAIALAACGGGGGAPKSPSDPSPQATGSGDAPKPAGGERQTTALVSQGTAVRAGPEDAPDAETPEQIFARVQADLVACYEKGRKAVTTMTSGKVTLNVAIDAAGKSRCVVASDDTGLTQEVEDCMSARMAREAFKANRASWATELPIVVNAGKVVLGPPATAAPALETVETHGLPDAAHDIVEALLPRLHKCAEGGDADPSLRVMHVGARVAKDGRVECALASSAAPLPAKVRECAADALASAKFPAPRGTFGLVSVPVKILARK